MALDITKERGTALDRHVFTWRELAGPTYSKLDDDAFTRVRVILMNGIESEAVRFSHACSRMNGRLQEALARIRRVEQHQQTLVNWLNPADQSPLETTIGFEQVAIEVTAALAQQEPDAYLAQVYRFGLLGRHARGRSRAARPGGGRDRRAAQADTRPREADSQLVSVGAADHEARVAWRVRTLNSGTRRGRRNRQFQTAAAPTEMVPAYSKIDASARQPTTTAMPPATVRASGPAFRCCRVNSSTNM
jgi:hypothetical protein